MYTGVKHLHSMLAYVLLAGLVFAILYTLFAYLNKKPFTEGNRKVALIGLICAHLQLLAGLVLYFVSPLGVSNASGAAMKDPASRLYFLEHPLMMIIAIVLITVGYSRAKRLTVDKSRYMSILIFFTLGLLFILSRIPWQVWP
jgi:NADH:ubiquinone oxidoreductase subunit 2 (subunit N)